MENNTSEDNDTHGQWINDLPSATEGFGTYEDERQAQPESEDTQIQFDESAYAPPPFRMQGWRRDAMQVEWSRRTSILVKLDLCVLRLGLCLTFILEGSKTLCR